MDLLLSPPPFVIQEEAWPVYSTLLSCLPHIVAAMNPANKSLISGGCSIQGHIEGAVIFPGTYIDKRAIIKNSVVMPGLA